MNSAYQHEKDAMSGNERGADVDQRQLIEDLRQHQFELQQQNEELSRAHSELNLATARYRDLWDNAPVGYIGLERSGLITVANRRAKAILQNVALLSDTASLQDFLTDHSKLVYSQHMWSVASSHTPVDAELQLRTKNGAPACWVRIESAAADNGEIKSALIDISPQKAAEAQHAALAQQLRQTQKMEVMHELSSGIAHDFNNILQVIVAYGDFIQTEMATHKIKTDSVAALLRGAERGVDLTRRLLAFSRKSTLQAKTLDLRRLAENTIALAHRTVGDHIIINASVCKTRLNVDVDGNLVEQALLNLCLNARDAMPDGGRLFIDTSGRELLNATLINGVELEPGSYAVITVADDGIGMSNEVQEKIFEPFFTTKGLKSGTGLGLSIVYGIVTQHSGAIEVNSSPGQGTQFSIFLPISAKQPACDSQKKIPVSAACRNAKGTILFAEDESEIRQLLCQQLQDAGYSVLLAEDGQQALRLINQTDEVIDLLLTDAAMPNASGKEVCEEFHKHCDSAPVIFLSGHGDSVVDSAFLDAHDALLLSKPVRFETLLEAIHRRMALTAATASNQSN